MLMRTHVLFCLAGCAVAFFLRGENLVIEKFDGTGRLYFNEISSATNYRIEWASSPAGPWTHFTALVPHDAILPTGTGGVSVLVPMCYRVVANVTNTTERYNLDDHLTPAGWVLDVKWGNAGLRNGRLEASPTDAFVHLYRDLSQLTRAFVLSGWSTMPMCRLPMME